MLVSSENLAINSKLIHSTSQLFEQEIYVWEKFEHDNIARLLGFAFNNENDPLLISPWMENGSAWHFVTKPENKDIDVYPLVSWLIALRAQINSRLNQVLGIARGLHYLHVEKLSIHSDLKAVRLCSYTLYPFLDTRFPRQMCSFPA